MLNRLIPKVRNLTLVMLFLCAIGIWPAMAYSSGASCPASSENSTTASAGVELAGTEKNVIIEKALKNAEVERLQKNLTGNGYSETGRKAYLFSSTFKDGTAVAVQVAVFEYVSPDGTVQTLNYLQNQKTGETLVVIASGANCLTCLVRLVSSGGLCTGACVTAGVFTGGIACIACLGLLGAWTACPCYHCACDSFGQACDLAASCSW